MGRWPGPLNCALAAGAARRQSTSAASALLIVNADGMYVHLVGGRDRGCIGTLESVRDVEADVWITVGVSHQARPDCRSEHILRKREGLRARAGRACDCDASILKSVSTTGVTRAAHYLTGHNVRCGVVSV